MRTRQSSWQEEGLLPGSGPPSLYVNHGAFPSVYCYSSITENNDHQIGFVVTVCYTSVGSARKMSRYAHLSLVIMTTVVGAGQRGPRGCAPLSRSCAAQQHWEGGAACLPSSNGHAGPCTATHPPREACWKETFCSLALCVLCRGHLYACPAGEPPALGACAGFHLATPGATVAPTSSSALGRNPYGEVVRQVPSFPTSARSWLFWLVSIFLAFLKKFFSPATVFPGDGT